jgi:hypothetical protein
MKTEMAVLIVIASFSVEPLAAQTIYTLVPGTKDNELVLSVSNESLTEDASMIKVTLTKNPAGIELCNRSVQIEKLKKGEEKEAIFTFDVSRVPGKAKDTLKFLLTDIKGESWNKEIIFEYALPAEFKLEQNYPNPFNPATTIEYAIPHNGRYNLSVFNILGQLVETLIEKEFQPGYYKTNFDAGRLSSGMYLFRLSGNDVNIIKKMMLIK